MAHPVKDCRKMELYLRTCTKSQIYKPPPPSPVDEVSVEESIGENVLNDEEEIEEEDREIEINDIKCELDCMKKRIQKLQLYLKQTDESCVCDELPCMDYEILLHCSKNTEICDLQKNNYKLQCQIKELVRCCNVAKDQIKELRTQMCRRLTEIEELQKAVNNLENWRNTLDHEFGVCLERFEYLKHVKAEWKDIVQTLEDHKHNCMELRETFVTKICLLRQKKDFVEQLDDLKKFFTEAFDNHQERMDNFEQRLTSIMDGNPKTATKNDN